MVADNTMEGTVVTAPSAPDPKDSLALVQQLQKELVQFAKSVGKPLAYDSRQHQLAAAQQMAAAQERDLQLGGLGKNRNSREQAKSPRTVALQARLETLQNLPSSTQALQQARRGARSGSRPGSAQTWRSNSPAQYDSMLVEHSAQQADTGPDEFQQAHERKLFASYNWKEKMYTADGISLGSIKWELEHYAQRQAAIDAQARGPNSARSAKSGTPRPGDKAETVLAQPAKAAWSHSPHHDATGTEQGQHDGQPDSAHGPAASSSRPGSQDRAPEVERQQKAWPSGRPVSAVAGARRSDNQGTPQRMPRIHEEEGWGEASGHTRPSSAGGMQSDKPMERTWQLKQPPKSKLRGLHLREQAAQPSRAAQLIAVEARRLVRHASEDGTALNLRSRLHSREQLLAVLEGCKALPRLQRLDLAGNMLTDDLAGFQELFKQPLFCDLDISDNRFRGASAPALADFVLQGALQLQALALANNAFGDRGIRQICSAAATSSALTTLDLRKCGITSLSADAVAQVLRSTNTLRTLKMSRNQLGPKGARELAAGLRANRSLQALDLAQNGLTDLGGSYIALSLLHNRSLTDLDLGSNQLGTETCSVLAHALSWNPVLKRLQLQHNPLGQEGAAKLLEAVAPGGSALTDLQLQHCSLVDVQPLAPSQQPNLLAGKTKAAKAKGMGKKKGASKQKEVQAPAKAAKAVPARPASAAGKAAPSAMSNTRQVFTLSRPAHRVRVLQLLAEVRQPGAPAWRNVLLNGKRIKGAVPPEDWPENMPEDGTLELEVRQPAKERGLVVSAADAPPDALVRRPASDRFIDQLCFHLEEGPHNSSTTDSWRLELLGLLACTHVELSISQVAELLHAFPADLDAAPGVYERAHAAGKLCSNIPPELHPSLAATLADQQLLDDAELRAFHKLTGIPLPFRAVQRKCDADGARVGAGKRLPSASPMQPTSTGGTASTARNDGTSSSRTPTSPAGGDQNRASRLPPSALTGSGHRQDKRAVSPGHADTSNRQDGTSGLPDTAVESYETLGSPAERQNPRQAADLPFAEDRQASTSSEDKDEGLSSPYSPSMPQSPAGSQQANNARKHLDKPKRMSGYSARRQSSADINTLVKVDKTSLPGGLSEGEAAQLPLELDSAGSESAHSPGSERAYLRQNSNGIWVPVG